MPLNDRECPACGVVVHRTHHCRGARREALTLEAIAANAAAVRAAIEEARNPAPPAVTQPPLMLDLDLGDAP